MALYAGEKQIKKVHWGPDQAKRIYLGNTMVYRATQNTTVIDNESRNGSSLEIHKNVKKATDCNFYNSVELRITCTPKAPSNSSIKVGLTMHIERTDGSIVDFSAPYVYIKSNTTDPVETSITVNVPDDFTPGPDGLINTYCTANIEGYGTQFEIFVTIEFVEMC